MIDGFSVLAGGLDHPEGVAWDPISQRVYAGGEAGQVYAIGLDGAVNAVADTGGFVLGLAVDGAGVVSACDVARGDVARVDPASGLVDGYASGMRATNWLAFDDGGRLYVTDSGDWAGATGASGR